MDTKLLAVGGVMRGGTTFLRAVLSSHPGIELFARELLALMWCERPTLSHIARVHHHLFLGKSWFRYPEFRRQAYNYLWHLVRENGLFRKQVTVDMCHQAFASCLASAGSLYVGDKHPDYVFQCQKILQGPDRRVILIVRDPRDVIASIFHRVRRGDWAGKSWVKKYSSIDGACRYWNEAARIMHGMDNPGSGALVIRYEDLITAHQDTTARIADYLDIDASRFDLSLVHKLSLGKHKQSLNASETLEIERRTAVLMSTFDYHAST